MKPTDLFALAIFTMQIINFDEKWDSANNAIFYLKQQMNEWWKKIENGHRIVESNPKINLGVKNTLTPISKTLCVCTMQIYHDKYIVNQLDLFETRHSCVLPWLVNDINVKRIANIPRFVLDYKMKPIKTKEAHNSI